MSAAPHDSAGYTGCEVVFSLSSSLSEAETIEAVGAALPGIEVSVNRGFSAEVPVVLYVNVPQEHPLATEEAECAESGEVFCLARLTIMRSAEAAIASRLRSAVRLIAPPSSP